MDLFKPLTRDERQLEAARAWIKAKGHGTIEAATGFGTVLVITGYTIHRCNL